VVIARSGPSPRSWRAARRGRPRPDTASGYGTDPQPWFVQVPFVDHRSCPCGCADRIQTNPRAEDNGLAPLSFEEFGVEMDRMAATGTHQEEMVRRTNAREVELPSVPVRGRVEEMHVMAIGMWAGHRYVLTGTGLWWRAEEPEVYPFPKQWLRPLRAVGEIAR
jgi:hypothetical protein